MRDEGRKKFDEDESDSGRYRFFRCGFQITLGTSLCRNQVWLTWGLTQCLFSAVRCLNAILLSGAINLGQIQTSATSRRIRPKRRTAVAHPEVETDPTWSPSKTALPSADLAVVPSPTCHQWMRPQLPPPPPWRSSTEAASANNRPDVDLLTRSIARVLGVSNRIICTVFGDTD